VAGVATALTCAALWIWVDAPLARILAPYRDTDLVALFDVLTILANGAIWYALALTGLVWAWRAVRGDVSDQAHSVYRQRFRAATFMIASMAMSGLLINALKPLIGRARPKFLVYEDIAMFAPLSRELAAYSFPSGHSQSIWAAMIALAWIYPPGRAWFIAFAVLISSTRIIVGAHFASDVVAGAFCAFAIAALLRWWFERSGIPLALAPRISGAQ
jgi:membrane-associated phospholipid phosphatase